VYLLPRIRMRKCLERATLSVCLSVCHTPVLYQNGQLNFSELNVVTKFRLHHP